MGGGEPFDQDPLKGESLLERRILGYLAKRRYSQDTFRGIVEWWILKQRIFEAMAEVKTALANMVAQGKLEVRSGRDGQVRYHLRRGKSGTAPTTATGAHGRRRH